MVKYISLDERTINLMQKLSNTTDNYILGELNHQSENKILQATIVCWLSNSTNNDSKIDKKTQFLLESLRASLLDDIYHSFLRTDANAAKEEQDSWYKKAQYIFLVSSGALLALCEGFDGIASLLGSFTSTPTVLLFAAGFAFALLSVGLFYGFELVEISKKVGVKLGRTGQLLDIYLEQVELIDKLKSEIDDCFADECLCIEERKELRQLASMLVIRFNAMDNAREYFVESAKSPALKASRICTAAMSALIFFCGGYFAGQTVALAVGGLFVASIAATAWPITVASFIVGIASLSMYWFIQRPGLENLVGHLVGLDKDNIDTFAGIENVETQKAELSKLETRVRTFENWHKKIEKSHGFFEETHVDVLLKYPRQNGQGADLCTLQEPVVSKLGLFSNFKRARSYSLNDLDRFFVKLQFTG